VIEAEDVLPDEPLGRLVPMHKLGLPLCHDQPPRTGVRIQGKNGSRFLLNPDSWLLFDDARAVRQDSAFCGRAKKQFLLVPES
jgi:hypothetical protein